MRCLSVVAVADDDAGYTDVAVGGEDDEIVGRNRCVVVRPRGYLLLQLPPLLLLPRRSSGDVDWPLLLHHHQHRRRGTCHRFALPLRS